MQTSLTNESGYVNEANCQSRYLAEFAFDPVVYQAQRGPPRTGAYVQAESQLRSLNQRRSRTCQQPTVVTTQVPNVRAQYVPFSQTTRTRKSSCLNSVSNDNSRSCRREMTNDRIMDMGSMRARFYSGRMVGRNTTLEARDSYKEKLKNKKKRVPVDQSLALPQSIRTHPRWGRGCLQ